MSIGFSGGFLRSTRRALPGLGQHTAPRECAQAWRDSVAALPLPQ